MRQHKILTKTIVAVGQYGPPAIMQTQHVLPTRCAHRALRLITDMEVDLGENFLAYRIPLAIDQRQQRRALQPLRSLNRRQHTNRRKQIDMTDRRVAHLPASETTRSVHDQHHPYPVITQMALHNGKTRPWSVV